MLSHHDKTGLVYREELKELYIIKEQSLYKKLNFKNKIFMDIGAHIGATTNMALTNGASKCICYEPMPETYEILKMNVGSRAEIHQKALVNNNDKSVKFYIHNKYPSCNSVLPIKNSKSIEVETLNFEDELQKHKPEILKVDCEGSEFLLFENLQIPDCIEEIAFELHLNQKAKKEKATELMHKFDDWYVHRKFKFNWYVAIAVLKKNIPSEYGKVKDYMAEL